MTSNDADNNSKTNLSDVPDDSEETNPGLQLDPSLPDPIRYSGNNYIGLGALVPETAWKSLNKDDEFLFEEFNGFSGRRGEPGSDDDKLKISDVKNTSPNRKLNISARKSDYTVVVAFRKTNGLELPSDANFEGFSLSFELEFRGEIFVPWGNKQTIPVKIEVEGPLEKSEPSNSDLLILTKNFQDLDIGDFDKDFSLKWNQTSISSGGVMLEDFYSISKFEITKDPSKAQDPQVLTAASLVKVQENDPLRKLPFPLMDLGSDKMVSVTGEVSGMMTNDDDPPQNYELDLTVPDPNTAAYALYQKTYNSFDFEVSLEKIQAANIITTSGATQFGLMVQDDPEDPTKKAFFGIIFSPKTYSTRKDNKPPIISEYEVKVIGNDTNEVANKVFVTNSNKTDTIKIIRKVDGSFTGYFRNEIIGKKTFALLKANKPQKAVIDKDTETRTPPKVEPNRKPLKIGIVCFESPVITYGDSLNLLLTPEVTFTTLPKIAIRDKILAVAERYNLSLFYGRYGYGQTVNTFTLLPGESTEISLTSSKSSKDTTSTKENIFSKSTDKSQSSLENSTQAEQEKSSEESESFDFGSSVSAGGGAFGFSFSASVNTNTSNSSSRQETARNVSSSVAKEAQEFSAENSFEATTSTTRVVDGKEVSAVTRTLENLNSNRVLNFVFRQLNQEYVSVLHLIDIRITALGRQGEFTDTSITGLKDFLTRNIVKKEVKNVYDKIIENIRYVENYEGELIDVLIETKINPDKVPFRTRKSAIKNLRCMRSKKTAPGTEVCETNNSQTTNITSEVTTEENTYLSFNNVDLITDYSITKDDKNVIEGIDGVILKVDEYVLRADGVVTEAIIGTGNALDDYGLDIQEEDIKERVAKNKILDAKFELLKLQKDITTGTSNEFVRYKYLQSFNFLEAKNDRIQGSTITEDFYWFLLNNPWIVTGTKAILTFFVAVALYTTCREVFLSSVFIRFFPFMKAD